MKQLWGGRFNKNINEKVAEFTSSIHFDKRLYKYDITGSIAHAKMLGKCKIISKKDSAKIVLALNKVMKEIEQGAFKLTGRFEDIHSAIEYRLGKIIGSAGEKLHTARSRNDQIALDIRMYLKDEICQIQALLGTMQKTLLDMSYKNTDIIMPGFTHLQHAQPVLFSHHLLAYNFKLSRDSDRLSDCLKRVDVMPLGAGALAGTTFPIDTEYVAKLLGFEKITDNSIDAVSDRDFVVEFLSCASLIMMHLSRLSEEMILWSSEEFNFIELDDSFCTGSSIMPQKKNPDVPELIRGKTGRVFGSLMGMLVVMKGLPLSYNRDMQEDKEALFDTIDTVKDVLTLYSPLLRTMKIHKKKMTHMAQNGFLNATDLADYMVTKGVTFRKAHTIAGKIVRYCIRNNKKLESLSLDEFKGFWDKFSADVFKVLNVSVCVSRRNSSGGTSPEEVLKTIKREQKKLQL